MGMTIKAELNYGYNLGDDQEEGWQFAEVGGEYDNPTVPWWDEDGDDFAEQAMEQLLRAAGFTETDRSADGYYDRRRAAETTIGVEFEHTGYEAGITLLVAKGRELHAYTSDVTELDPAVMTATADEPALKALANALKTLGITPKQEKPAWLLTCYYG